jgi:hypothetical protein
MDETPLTPSRLWKQMSPAQRHQAALAFWRDEQAIDDQVQAALMIAQRKKFRPKSVLALDDERKAKHLASLPSLPDTIAARTLVIYHLSAQRPLMGAFLDALGIAHENGLIEEDEVKPDPAKLPAAVVALEGQFPADDVGLYLRTLLSQDPETWSGLRAVLSV